MKRWIIAGFDDGDWDLSVGAAIHIGLRRAKRTAIASPTVLRQRSDDNTAFGQRSRGNTFFAGPLVSSGIK